jgi:hypothetical protein
MPRQGFAKSKKDKIRGRISKTIIDGTGFLGLVGIGISRELQDI